MGTTPGSPGAWARTNQLAAKSATITTLLNLCPNPIAFTRTGRYREPVDQPKHHREEPPTTPTAIIQKEISRPPRAACEHVDDVEDHRRRK
jgi:hypothetical protein